MTIGINTSYNNYFYSSLQQTNSISKNTKKSDQDYLNELKEKYHSLKFSIGYSNATGPISTGLGNVALHPNLLKKMASDPEFAAKVENNIKYIPQAEAWKKSMIESNGSKLVASGCFVDENGNVSSWSMSTTTIGNPKDDERKENLEILQERLEMKRILAKRADQKTLEEKLKDDTINANIILSRYEANYSTTDPSLGIFNKLA